MCEQVSFTLIRFTDLVYSYCVKLARNGSAKNGKEKRSFYLTFCPTNITLLSNKQGRHFKFT